MNCLACNKPVDQHLKWTAEDIDASAKATFAFPVILPNGYKALGPTSPKCIGQYVGHDPVPPFQHLRVFGAARTFCGRDYATTLGMIASPEFGFAAAEVYGPPCPRCQTALAQYA
jgi:hypothetical protein